jgi:RHS repeat-associated protein
LLSVHHPSGATDHFVYDTQGRLIATDRNGNADQVTWAYGPSGEVSATNHSGAMIKYFFDAQGLLAKVIDSLGNVTHYIYDSTFNLTKVIDPAGQISSNTYDENRNLIKSTGPDGRTIAYTYSGPFNDLTSYTDPNGNTTNYGYDSSGNLLAISYANASQLHLSYDPLGNLSQSTNARGQVIQDTHNNMGKLTKETFADGTFLAYGYDAHGNLISASDGTNTTTFQYDPITEDLLQIDYPAGLFLKFSYGAEDRRTQSVDQNGFTVNYTYTPTGQLAGLTEGAGNLIVNYTYDIMDRLVREDMGNLTYTTYLYDPAGNILHLVNYGADGSVNSRFDYTYDSLGRRTRMTTLDGAWEYQYDPAGQLTRAVFSSSNPLVVPNQDLQYMYDLAGNRTESIVNGVTTTYVVNNMNQYTQVGSANLSYDADGNLIAQTGSAGTTNYAYDELNQLVGVSSPSNISAYQYDPLGNLAGATQNHQTTRYVVDPAGLGNVVAQYNGSDGLIANYTYGLGLTSRVAAGGQAGYYDFDALGSAVGISGADGTYQNLYRYLPFGQALTSLESVANPFQFVGQFGVQNEGNGLGFMRARFYSPTDGRFTIHDPLGLNGGQANLYVYVNNDPVNEIDPSGLDFRQPNHCDEVAVTVFENCEANGGHFAACLAQAAIAKRLCELGSPAPNLSPPPPPPPTPPTPPPPPPPGPTPPVVDCPALIEIDGRGVVIPCPPPPRSHDPNAKTGPAGFGPQGFIAAGTLLPYRIDFENDATATAPARRVLVTDALDPNIDWSTLQFTEVGFGDNIITVPAGSQHFQTTIAITYGGLTFNVLIELAFDSSTGVVTATFQSIDPTTELPPPVLIGFLPPEDGTGRGLGYFGYTVMPKSGLPTGTQFRNVATVVFDDNPPITTDQVNENDPTLGVDPAKECLNTIDAVAPTGGVNVLPAFSPATFTVTWAGQDDPGGSGIAAFVVYVSDNGGEFTLWQSETTATSASFTGQNGHTYDFYAAAFDNAGNAQVMLTGAQATTTVDATPPTSSVSELPAFSAALFDVRWSGSDGNGSGIASYRVYVSDNGNPFTVWQSGTTQSAAVFTGVEGHVYAFYSVATDNIGNVEATPTAAEATTVIGVADVGSSIIVRSSENPARLGDSVAFTATVAPARSNNGTPTGTIQFEIDGVDAGLPVILVDGAALFTPATLADGRHTVTAIYASDNGLFKPSAGTLSGGQEVTAGATVSLRPSSIRSVYGQAVTFTVTVSSTTTGLPVPTGRVTFFDGSAAIGSLTLRGGSAKLATSRLLPGSHTINVVYSGDDDFAGGKASASSPLVTQDATKTIVKSSVNPSAPSQRVRLTARVVAAAPGAGTPTGSVEFMSGSTVIGTVTLHAGAATLTTKKLALGTSTITAVYRGNSDFKRSTSKGLKQIVKKPATAKPTPKS